MKRITIDFFLVFITIIITAVACKPASLLIFKLTEHYFKCPIAASNNIVTIRNDGHGVGSFGAKRSGGRSHTGIDIRARIGTPVYASKSGVAFCLNVPTGYGKYVMIYHPDSSQTLYGHLSNWNIPPVKEVRRGDMIGFVGKTGNAKSKSIDSHLHFEIRKNGVPVDPEKMIRK